MAYMIASHTSTAVQGNAALTRCGCECENARKRSMYQSSYSGAMDLSDYDIGEEVGSDDCLHLVGEKKKRLKFSQVKRLEKSFEVANRLEPETKIRLAKELGLRPRQIAVWFQNRRARRKTKQVEKDFDALKKEYDALKSKYHILLEENKKLKDKGNCSYLSTNSLDVIGHPNDLVCIEAEAPQNSFNFEIEPKQNSATSVLQPTDFPMELSVKSTICQKCAVPVRDIYPTATKEQEAGGYCSITSEAASSVFNIESTPSPRFPHNIAAAAAANFSPISVVEGSSIGEQIAAGLETPPAGDELHCLQETLPELDVDQIASINQAEETCRRLFYGLNEEGPLMLWDY